MLKKSQWLGTGQGKFVLEVRMVMNWVTGTGPLQKIAALVVLGLATVRATSVALPVVDVGYAIHQAHLSVVSVIPRFWENFG